MGTGDGAVQPRPESVPWCCRAGGSPCRSRAGARRGPRARWPGHLALAVARRTARAVCRRLGCAAAASRSSSPGSVPGGLAGCAAGTSRRPGTPARCLAARACRRPASAAGARTVSQPMPAAGSGRDAIPGPVPDDRPAPHSRATDGAAQASPELSAWPGGTGAGGLQVPPAGAVSPHRPSEPCPDFFESCRSSWSPVTESNRRPSPYHGDALPTELTGPIFTYLTWAFAILSRDAQAALRCTSLAPHRGQASRPITSGRASGTEHSAHRPWRWSRRGVPDSVRLPDIAVRR